MPSAAMNCFTHALVMPCKGMRNNNRRARVGVKNWAFPQVLLHGSLGRGRPISSDAADGHGGSRALRSAATRLQQSLRRKESDTERGRSVDGRPYRARRTGGHSRLPLRTGRDRCGQSERRPPAAGGRIVSQSRSQLPVRAGVRHTPRGQGRKYGRKDCSR